ncbi:MAG: short-chain dehydrogenase [Bacteroidetes bacterium HGW-Bacteroidetes-6]|jgi:membrane protein YqaA with SNARE-associated domain|nr:MAG: short-chain dehydrogenase [Bacteroidetes bacterium HGW-Bacteroidetes-6]
MPQKPKSIFQRWWLQFKYFRRSGFYAEVGKSLLKFVLIFGIAFVLLYFAGKYFLDIDKIFGYFVHHVPYWMVISAFFVSESLLSPIPADLFIIWSEEMANPWLMLTLLAILSYVAGIVSYSIGRAVRENRRVNNYFSLKFEKHIKNSKKWGGWLIAAAALTPLPFSMTMVTIGMLHYPARRMLLWSLFRIPRFFLYALVLYKAVNI